MSWIKDETKEKSSIYIHVREEEERMTAPFSHP